MKKLIVFCLFLCMIFVGCNELNNFETNSQFTTQYIDPDFLVSPTATIIPTQLITKASIDLLTPTSFKTQALTNEITRVASNTQVPNISPEILPEFQLEINCIEITDASKEISNSIGGVVLESRETNDLGQLETGLFLKNFETSTIKKIDSNGTNIVVSYDKKMMAYKSKFVSGEDGSILWTLKIVDINGYLLNEIQWGENWGALMGWTTDERLIIEYREKNWELTVPSWHLLFDPFNSNQEFLLPDYPNYINNVIPYWDGWFGVVYDPTGQRAIYPRLLDGDEIKFGYAYWDISNEIEISFLENIYPNEAYSWVYGASQTPRWSPDGSQFVYIGYEEIGVYDLFSVDRNGIVTKITQLGNIVELIDRISWSPDNQKIALIGYASYRKPDATVLFLDLETRQVVDYCIPLRGLLPEAIWSPDGTQILVVDRKGSDHQRVILIDISKDIAYVMAEDMEPGGWIKKP